MIGPGVAVVVTAGDAPPCGATPAAPDLVDFRSMPISTHINPEGLPINPAFTQVVRVPAGADTIYVGGQSGIDADGLLVGPGLAEQARQAFFNLRTCLDAAGASLTDVVKWTVLCLQDAPLHEGVAAFGEIWPREAPPPAITVALVAGLAVPGALVEIEAVAVVRP